MLVTMENNECVHVCLNSLHKIIEIAALPFTTAGSEEFGLYWRKAQ